MEEGKMEDEKPKNEEIEVVDVEIGEDKPQIIAKKVVIEDVKAIVVKFNNEESKKIVLKVRHPDMKELIDISGARYEVNSKIKTSGLWYKLDNDGKLNYNSAIARVIRHLGKNKLSELKGEQMDTVADEGGYLVVKAY